MNLNLLLQFVSEQWILFAALSVVIAMFIRHEMSRGAPGLTPQQSIRRVNSDGGIFLDIREVGDFKQGHIADALHIHSGKLAARMSELESYKEIHNLQVPKT